ncbi:MAG: DEAD/DEAH box helicase [Anaerolineaceae bacterium]|nr:MAG: DEAD/DEAH box helicase [Anaerolineaceae bacterium]
MRGELVALDLETTGLDVKNDHIIEVGAVRIKDGEIIAEFSTMINPGVSIPSKVTHLTGIRQEDINGAPSIDSALPQIAAFVGDAPVIAHNVAFDMGFLQQRHGILRNNVSIDTYDLAAILLPTAPRYNLNSLTSHFDIDLEHAHRALDDARATALLYWALWKELTTLPATVLDQIIALSDGLSWGTAITFKAAQEDQAITRQAAKPSGIHEYAQDEIDQNIAPSVGVLDLSDVSHYIGENGIFHERITGFQHRGQQLVMAQAITSALAHNQHLIVEAGTGTGKSIGYLLPAILWAVETGERVVISTNTINLQEQLINDTIPQLRDALGIPFTARVMKGRGNYISPKRLQMALRRRGTSILEARTLAKLLVWQLQPNSGDKGEVNLRGSEHGVWAMVSADDGSSDSACDGGDFDTPFCRARRAAENANILIVNHALLIADARSQNKVLPPYQYLIIDEAHQLESAITYGLSGRIDANELNHQLTFLGDTSRGLLRDVLNTVRAEADHKEAIKLEAFVQSISEAVGDMAAHIHALFRQIGKFLKSMRGDRNEFVMLVRIDQSYRNKPAFGTIQVTWRNLSEYFTVLISALERLRKFLNKMTGSAAVTAHISDINMSVERLKKSVDLLDHLIQDPQANEIYWMSFPQGAESPTAHCAPLHVGKLMREYIWDEKSSVILTSATLKTHDDFQFIQSRLEAEAVPTLDVGSPFDYQQSTLIFIPRDVPEPTDRNKYQQAVEKSIIELAAALNGRVMVLFTSYSQLRQTAQAITPRLTLGDITVYNQSDGTSRHALLEGFKADERAVLLGTKSFWEGVDIPGDDLSALIITRLPFSVPTDPIFSARAETYSNPFDEYNLPDAVLMFRQGFGRLIRRQTDRGVIVVMDGRIRTKRYGASFIDALPDCTIEDAELSKLGEIASHWINRTQDD